MIGVTTRTVGSGEMSLTGMEGVDACWVIDHERHPTLGITRTGLMLMRATADHAGPAAALLGDRLASAAQRQLVPRPFVVASTSDVVAGLLARHVATVLEVPFESLHAERRGRLAWFGRRRDEPVAPFAGPNVLLIGTSVVSASAFAGAASHARERGATCVVALAAVLSVRS